MFWSCHSVPVCILFWGLILRILHNPSLFHRALKWINKTFLVAGNVLLLSGCLEISLSVWNKLKELKVMQMLHVAWQIMHIHIQECFTRIYVFPQTIFWFISTMKHIHVWCGLVQFRAADTKMTSTFVQFIEKHPELIQVKDLHLLWLFGDSSNFDTKWLI